MTGVVIAGVGMHPFGRFEGVSTTDMGVQAVRAALREAGVGKGGFQAAFCGTAYGGVATGHKVLSRLGMTGMPIVDVEAGCASGGAALMLAAGAIRAGQYDTVLVFGTEKMPRGIIRSSFFEPWQEEAGLAATPSFFALRAQRVTHDVGGDKGPPGAGRGEEPPPRRGESRTRCSKRRSPPRRSSPRGSSASRSICSCCARPTRARRRWC